MEIIFQKKKKSENKNKNVEWKTNLWATTPLKAS